MTAAENGQGRDTRKLFSLAEAAAAAGSSESHILALAADGRLPIYVRVPEEVRAYRSSTALLSMNDGTHAGLLRGAQLRQFASGVRPRLLNDAAFLVLDAWTCKQLAAHGGARPREFGDAYRISAELDLALIEQPRVQIGEAEADIGTELVVCYLRHQEPVVMGVQTDASPVSIPLTVSGLHLSHRDMVECGLIRGGVLRNFDNGFREEPHMSKMLIDLNEAAWRFWGRTDENWEVPANESVEEWLKGRGWKVKVREAAATILRDSYESWSPEAYERYSAAVGEEKQGKPMSFVPAGLNKFDAVVFIAQRWKNADLQPGERAEKLDTYPDKAETIDLLQKRYGFAWYLASAAWRITAPDKMIKKGRPPSAE